MKNRIILMTLMQVAFVMEINCQLANSLEEYYKLDETSGQAVNSVNPGVNNSSSITATRGATGIIGNAFSFDGVSQRVDFADHSNWTIITTSSLTISAWIYLAGDIASNGYGSIWGHQSGPQFFLEKSSPGNYKFGWYSGSSDYVSTGSMSFSFDTWYHVVITKDGSSVSFYRNNENVGTFIASDIDVDPSAVYIGADSHASYEAFNGRIDELGIWKRALSSEEASQLYNGGSGLAYPFNPGNNYTLTTTVSPSAGGSITLSPSGGSYAAGTTVTATAVANSEYTFSGWSGALSGSASPDNITMNSNKTLTAIFTPTTPDPGAWQTNGSNVYYNGGNVGIGTTSPSSKLTVNGKILATEVEVVSNIASDYVFEPAYQLMPLTDLEIYLKQHKHLPGIPSALEFKDKGQNLGEMQDLLLRKIEELTLYIIELKKENESLKELNSQVQKLRIEMDQLKNK